MAHISISKRIVQHEWNEQLDRMVDWFKVRQVSTEQSARMYEKIYIYPYDSLKYAIDKLIDERRPTAGNWPTINELVNGCHEWLHKNPEEWFKIREFDPEEDPEYPLIKLWKGLDVLQKMGMATFMSFAKANKMPKQDQERVINKERFIRQNQQADSGKLAAGIGKAVG